MYYDQVYEKIFSQIVDICQPAYLCSLQNLYKKGKFYYFYFISLLCFFSIADIKERVRAMLLEYVSNPNGVILAVTAANTDLAGSDVLQLARAVDPRGDRTVGVLTKLDLMDPGRMRPREPMVIPPRDWRGPVDGGYY